MLSILVRAPNWLGDAVMAMPLIQGLVSQEKVENITLFARPSVAELLSLIDSPKIRIIAETGKFSFFKNAKAIKGQYHMAFVLSPYMPSLLPVLMAGVSAVYGITSFETSLFVKNGIRADKPLFRKRHLINSYLELMGIAGFNEECSLPTMKQDRSIAESFGIEKEKYFVLAPGARFGPAKMWPAESFARVAGELISTGLKIVILGGPDEKDTAGVIRAINGNSSGIIDLTGKTTITQASSILAGAAFALTNDSGLMHLSYINGTKTFAIFGSTSPLWTGPRFNSSVFYSGRECSPCFKRRCRFGHYGCLKDIDPVEVVQKILKEITFE